MKRPGFVLALAVMLIAVAAVMGVYLAQPSGLGERVQALEGQLNQARAEIAGLRAEKERLQATVKSRESEARSARRLDVAAGAAPAGDAGGIQHYRLSKMDERMIEMSHGALFLRFGLNEEELAHFKQLLGDRRMTLNDLTAGMLAPGLTPQQRIAVAQETAEKRNAVKSQFDAAIRHFLNNEEDYKALVEWEESSGERMHVKYALPVFAAEGDPLSPEQQERLLALMTVVRKARPPLPKGSSSEARNLQQDAEKLQILQQAAAFLNPHQVQVLKKTSIAVPR
jgi:uncharacterized iron-regulated membrane protein